MSDKSNAVSVQLRELQPKDIPGMLEWMHDSEINQFYRFDAESMTEKSVIEFINAVDEDSKHFAVVDDADEYMGTISLKNIDMDSKKAEYAIALRKSVQGKGVSTKATDAILNIAFNAMGLNKVYLNVLADNGRANGFYKKYGFAYEGTFREDIFIKGKVYDLSWYSMLKTEFEAR